VKEALDRLMKGRTTLIIAHRLSTVMGADRVLVLDEGKIIQSGKHAALMQEEGLYKKLVERQLEQGQERQIDGGAAERPLERRPKEGDLAVI
jgi:ATP-binding cassette subfamily B protein